MICTVIQHKTLQEILAVLAGCRMAEVRLDRCSLSLDEIEECFSQDVPAVATCRVSEVAAAAPSDLCRDIEPPPVLEERRTDKALQHRIGITVYERPESG